LDVFFGGPCDALLLPPAATGRTAKSAQRPLAVPKQTQATSAQRSTPRATTEPAARRQCAARVASQQRRWL